MNITADAIFNNLSSILTVPRFKITECAPQNNQGHHQFISKQDVFKVDVYFDDGFLELLGGESIRTEPDTSIWKNLTIVITHSKFVLTVTIDNQNIYKHEFNLDSSDLMLVFYFNLHRPTVEQSPITIEYINGGTDEDIVLFVLGNM